MTQHSTQQDSVSMPPANAGAMEALEAAIVVAEDELRAMDGIHPAQPIDALIDRMNDAVISMHVKLRAAQRMHAVPADPTMPRSIPYQLSNGETRLCANPITGCRIKRFQRIDASYEDLIELEICDRPGDLTPDLARRLAARLIALADEIDPPEPRSRRRPSFEDGPGPKPTDGDYVLRGTRSGRPVWVRRTAEHDRQEAALEAAYKERLRKETCQSGTGG